jgi:hypothetical protein
MMYINESKDEFLGKIVTRMALPGYKGVPPPEKGGSKPVFPRGKGKCVKKAVIIRYFSIIY